MRSKSVLSSNCHVFWSVLSPRIDALGLLKCPEGMAQPLKRSTNRSISIPSLPVSLGYFFSVPCFSSFKISHIPKSRQVSTGNKICLEGKFYEPPTAVQASDFTFASSLPSSKEQRAVSFKFQKFARWQESVDSKSL